MLKRGFNRNVRWANGNYYSLDERQVSTQAGLGERVVANDEIHGELSLGNLLWPKMEYRA